MEKYVGCVVLTTRRKSNEKRKTKKGYRKNVTVYFRVSDVYRNVRIVVKNGDSILISKKKQKVAPGEMETVTLKAEQLENISGTLTFSLEFDERAVK